MNTLRNTASLLLLLTAISSAAACAAPIADPTGPEAGSSELASFPYFDLFEGADGRFYFNFKAANHQTILSSQAYSSRAAALGGYLSVLDNGEFIHRYELREAADGQYYFVLEAANGRTIGVSETYVSASNARRAIETVSFNIGSYLDYQSIRVGERFDVFVGADGRHYWNLHAGNGEIVLSGQGYSSEAAALNGAFSVVENGVDESRYDIREAQSGGFYFNLKAGNGHVIGTSEVYSTHSNAVRATGAIVELLGGISVI